MQVQLCVGKRRAAIMRAYFCECGIETMQVRSEICIIGDGVIGKTAALAFAQAGLKVTLLRPAAADPSASAADAWDVRVYALNHAAHALLSPLKVWDALDASRVAPVDAMSVNGDAAGALAFDA